MTRYMNIAKFVLYLDPVWFPSLRFSNQQILDSNQHFKHEDTFSPNAAGYILKVAVN